MLLGGRTSDKDTCYILTNQTTPNVNPVGVDGEGLGAGRGPVIREVGSQKLIESLAPISDLFN